MNTIQYQKEKKERKKIVIWFQQTLWKEVDGRQQSEKKN